MTNEIKWISVDDDLPKKSEYYYTVRSDGSVDMHFFSVGKNEFYDYGAWRITHWMEKPAGLNGRSAMRKSMDEQRKDGEDE